MFTSVLFFNIFVMSKKLFIGNISWWASREDLEKIFWEYGETEEVILIKDENWRSKGFGFVTYVNDADWVKAMEALNEFQIDWRPLFVNEARPQEKKERNFR